MRSEAEVAELIATLERFNEGLTQQVHTSEGEDRSISQGM